MKERLKDILAEATETDDSVCYVTSDDADALKVAIKSLELWDKLENELTIMMEGDKRTFSNQITEDGLFYDGLYAALKIVRQFIQFMKEV